MNFRYIFFTFLSLSVCVASIDYDNLSDDRAGVFIRRSSHVPLIYRVLPGQAEKHCFHEVLIQGGQNSLSLIDKAYIALIRAVVASGLEHLVCDKKNGEPAYYFGDDVYFICDYNKESLDWSTKMAVTKFISLTEARMHNANQSYEHLSDTEKLRIGLKLSSTPCCSSTIQDLDDLRSVQVTEHFIKTAELLISKGIIEVPTEKGFLSIIGEFWNKNLSTYTYETKLKIGMELHDLLSKAETCERKVAGRTVIVVNSLKSATDKLQR